MRLIDADALILATQQDGAYGYVSAKEIADAPTVIEVVDECPADWDSPEDEIYDELSVWVTSTLPEESTEVLVTVKNGSRRRVCLAWVVDGEWHGLLSNEEVVAWMPFPEVYEGE